MTRRRRQRSSLVAVVACVAVAVSAAAVASGEAFRGDARPSAAGTAAPCNYYYEWIGKTRFPLQADPHATYTYVVPSSQAAKDRIGFLVRGQFVHAVWSSWLVYGKNAKPYSGANLVNNPPANTNGAIVADPGSIDPFVPGQPMLGSPRNFTLLFEPKHYPEKDLAPSLDGTPTADIAASNRKLYPPSASRASFWALANRDYQAFPGYNPGGTTKDTFPTVTAVKLATGEPVDCQAYNLLPPKLQRAPTDPPEQLNYGRVPIRIALRNGAHFDLLGDLGGGSRSQFAPKNPPGLVQFARAPLGPGADVATVPPSDNCSGYLATRTSTRLVSLVRIPHIPNYTDTQGLTPSSTYPNPVRPGQPWQAAFVSLSMYGSSSGFYLPGDPRTSSIADGEFKPDRTGGSTVLIWPRDLPRRQRARVFDYARRKGWAIVRGGTSGRQTSANVLVRVKAPASDYFGGESHLPCFFDAPENRHKPWSEIPVQNGSPWVASAENLGAAAPQGVTCRSIRILVSERCLGDLKRQIRVTGGHYFARG